MFLFFKFILIILKMNIIYLLLINCSDFVVNLNVYVIKLEKWLWCFLDRDYN